VSHPLSTFEIANAELLEISTMNIADVRRELAVTRSEKARLAAREIALVARMEALLADESNPAFVVPEHELVAHAGMTSREARDVVNRTHVAEAAPDLAEVLANGSITSVLERRVEQMFHAGDDIPVVVAPGIEPNDHRRALACPTG
jgi:hypothetical protein